VLMLQQLVTADLCACQEKESLSMNPCTLDIQALQTQFRQSLKQVETTPVSLLNIAVKLQSLFLPFFTQNRSAITITLKKTVPKRPYKLKISKKTLSLYRSEPKEQMHYYFHEEQSPHEDNILNFRPEQFQAFSETILSILDDLKADKAIVEEYLGDTHGTL